MNVSHLFVETVALVSAMITCPLCCRLHGGRGDLEVEDIGQIEDCVGNGRWCVMHTKHPHIDEHSRCKCCSFVTVRDRVCSHEREMTPGFATT